MNWTACLVGMCVMMPLLAACALGEIVPDPELVKFTAMSEQARQIAQKEIPDAVLRQADTDLIQTTFRFADKAGTRELDVTAPSSNTPPDQWTANLISLSPLLGRPESDMSIQDLHIAPNRVAQAALAQWPGCHIRVLILYRDENENDLTWVAFCDTTLGTMSGNMSNRTGLFQSPNAPPAQIPVTATPER